MTDPLIHEPRKRGTKPGTKTRRLFEHVCPAAGCPRKGKPFKGTAKAKFCSTACGLRDWRARRKEAQS